MPFFFYFQMQMFADYLAVSFFFTIFALDIL